MKDLFVTEDIAKKLALLGFDEVCFCGFDGKYPRELWFPAASDRNSTTKPRVYKKTCHQNKHIIKAATWEQAISFFETRGLYTNIGPEFYRDGINWIWQILWYLPNEDRNENDIYDGTMSYGDNGEYPSRQLAIKAAVEKMISIMEDIGKDIIKKIINQEF